MGHVINYTISDVVARYNMMRGYDVLVPMGWDSFGLPAENAAIRENIHPSENIKTNIDKMKKFSIKMGIPDDSCHLFRYKPATRSGVNLPGIPG